MIVFKQLYKELNIVKEELNKRLPQEPEYKKFKTQQDLLLDIEMYLLSYDWVSHKKFKERVKLFIRSDFDYDGCAEYFDIHKNTFETSMSYAGKRFKNKIGENTLDLISEGRTSEAKMAYNLSRGQITLNSLLLPDIVSIMPEPEASVTIRLDDCRDELEFLRTYAKEEVRKKMKELEGEHMSYIRKVIESSEAKYSEQRFLITAYLLGGIPDTETLLQVYEAKKEERKNRRGY